MCWPARERRRRKFNITSAVAMHNAVFFVSDLTRITNAACISRITIDALTLWAIRDTWHSAVPQSRNIAGILDPKNVDRRVKNNNYRYPCKPPTPRAKYTLSCSCNYVYLSEQLYDYVARTTHPLIAVHVFFFLNIVYIHSLLYNIEIYNIIYI